MSTGLNVETVVVGLTRYLAGEVEDIKGLEVVGLTTIYGNWVVCLALPWWATLKVGIWVGLPASFVGLLWINDDAENKKYI